MFSGTKGYRTKPPVGVRLNPLHPLSQGLVGYWLFNEGSGSVAHDISGKGNHGTLTNMSPNAQNSGWCGSKFGGGLSFDGSDDHVNLPSGPSAPYTIGFWAKPNNISGDMAIIGYGDSSVGGDGVAMGFYSGTNEILIGNDSYQHGLDGVSSYLTNHVWQYWVNVVHAADNIDFYLDGNKMTLDVTTYYTNDVEYYLIGVRHATTLNKYFDGSIDQVQLYNRALSPAEIKQLYEDPFCNLLRVPVRYAPAVAGGLPIPVAMNYYRRRRVA